MELVSGLDASIDFPRYHWENIVSHCQRKLDGIYLLGEPEEKKAFGLIAGQKEGSLIRVKQSFPLLKNARYREPYAEYMNLIMKQHAIPSETPLDKRGWVADPQEIVKITGECQEKELVILGAYHMHRVGWSDDPIRDTPTTLDKILAEESRMIMFVISMVNPEKPLMRAFYEGDPEQEIPIAFT